MSGGLDSVLTTKVKAAILDEATLKTLQINVETFKGIVQLTPPARATS